MSNFGNVEGPNRSYSPYATRFYDSSSPFDRQRDLIHERVSRLASSPNSRSRIEQTFEEMLKSIHFFKKPDIIPFPYLKTDQTDVSEDLDKYKELLDELEREKNLRRAAEKENESLKDRLAYLSDIESQYEEYRIKSLKLSDIELEIEKLNSKIRVLLEENEELRRKIRGGHEANLSQDRHFKDLEQEREKNLNLLKQLSDLKEAYEELKRSYNRDVSGQADKYQRLYEDKLNADFKLKDLQDKFYKTTDSLNEVDNEIQSKIQNLKNEYRYKLKDLENRFTAEKPDNSENRLKEIEDRLTSLQGKIAGQDKRTSREPTPTKDLVSATANWGRFSPQRLPRSKNQVSDKQAAGSSPSRPANKSPYRSPGSPARSSRTKSPQVSPKRSGSNERLNEHVHECETCVRRHGHDWAKAR